MKPPRQGPVSATMATKCSSGVSMTTDNIVHMRAHKGHRNAYGHHRKSAVELLAASKSSYVKSSEVLNHKQELKHPENLSIGNREYCLSLAPPVQSVTQDEGSNAIRNQSSQEVNNNVGAPPSKSLSENNNDGKRESLSKKSGQDTKNIVSEELAFKFSVPATRSPPKPVLPPRPKSSTKPAMPPKPGPKPKSPTAGKPMPPPRPSHKPVCSSILGTDTTDSPAIRTSRPSHKPVCSSISGTVTTDSPVVRTPRPSHKPVCSSTSATDTTDSPAVRTSRPSQKPVCSSISETVTTDSPAVRTSATSVFATDKTASVTDKTAAANSVINSVPRSSPETITSRHQSGTTTTSRRLSTGEATASSRLSSGVATSCVTSTKGECERKNSSSSTGRSRTSEHESHPSHSSKSSSRNVHDALKSSGANKQSAVVAGKEQPPLPKPRVQKQLADVVLPIRRQLHRSHSDVSSCKHSLASSDFSDLSSRLSRTSTEIARFFNEMGIDRVVLEPMRRLADTKPRDLDDLSSFGSQDAHSLSSRLSHNDGEKVPADGEPEHIEISSSSEGTSVVERNARIIKWLCNVKKAHSPPTKQPVVDRS